MSNNNLKMGPHDVGGEFDYKIDTHDHGMTYWEKFSNGLVLCVPETGLIKLDELRKTAESFGDDYFKMDYFLPFEVPAYKPNHAAPAPTTIDTKPD